MPEESKQPDQIRLKPPPSWQRRSRWFPYMDAGDALVLSWITVLVVLVFSGVVLFWQPTVLRTHDPVFQVAPIIATTDGYTIEPERTATDPPRVGDKAGRFAWCKAHEARGYFGPFPIVERTRPRAWIFLDGAYTITDEQADQLIARAPGTLNGYSFAQPTGIAESDSNIVRFELAPIDMAFNWFGVVLNLGAWLTLAFGFWAFAWLIFSLSAFFDPRRKRAFKLGASLCPRCDYDIRMIESPRCPECGERLTIEPEPG